MVLALLTSGHVVLNKRDTRAAIGWVGLIALVPGIGTILYVLLGMNRIKRHGTRPRPERRVLDAIVSGHVVSVEQATALLPDNARDLEGLIRLVERTTSRPLLEGNAIEPLRDGDEAYPAMLEAIAGATRSIALATYIFDTDSLGRRFVDALAAARARGVDVR
ncbi:MAG: PLDc N-terminal domain-containing protein, partial [Polyangiaceae bacterium]